MDQHDLHTTLLKGPCTGTYTLHSSETPWHGWPVCRGEPWPRCSPPSTLAANGYARNAMNGAAMRGTNFTRTEKSKDTSGSLATGEITNEMEKLEAGSVYSSGPCCTMCGCLVENWNALDGPNPRLLCRMCDPLRRVLEGPSHRSDFLRQQPKSLCPSSRTQHNGGF